MWFLTPCFIPQVRSWSDAYRVEGTPNFVLASNLKMMKDDFKVWNTSVFCQVTAQKQIPMVELRALDAQAEVQQSGAVDRSRRVQIIAELERFML